MNDAPATRIQQEIAEMQDAYYHKLLKQGGVIVAVKDETGQVVGTELVDFPAAMMNAINAWRKHLKIQSPAAGEGGGGVFDEAASRMADGRIRFNGKDIMPPLDEQGEDAALG